MKKSAIIILIFFLMVMINYTLADNEEFDLEYLKRIDGFSYNEADQSWKLYCFSIVHDPKTFASNSFAVVLNGTGKTIDLAPYFQMINYSTKPYGMIKVVIETNYGTICSVEKAGNFDVYMIPILSTMKDLLLEMCIADSISIHSYYDSGEEFSFVVSGEDYDKIRTCCQLLNLSGAVSAIDSNTEAFLARQYIITIEKAN